MRVPSAEESLFGWRKARESKARIFGFCIFGFLVSVGVYFASYYLPAPKVLVSIYPYFRIFEKIFGLLLATIYGGATLFFGISFFTPIWEKICDYKIKKFESRIAADSNRRTS